MRPQQQSKRLFTRSEFLRMSAGTVAATAAVGSLSTSCGVDDADIDIDIDALLGELDEKVRAAMQQYGIPGVGLGLVYNGTEYTRGYGVTNVDDPQQQVDDDTLFLIGSTTKTFTGTAVMRLVDQGKLDLDAPVQTYLPDFATSDPAVAPRVTLRQLLNHTPGWLGEDPHDTGSGDDALARFVADIERLPQLTPPGEVFQYNNVAISLAGRLIEVANGSTYEEAVRELVLEPLGMSRSRFFSDESELAGSLAGSNVAGPHAIEDGEPVLRTSVFDMPRQMRPAGGLFSSVRDLIQYAAFHLGDGRAQDGTRLLTNESLVAMRSSPGPGGTLILELDGVGVTWELRPSAEGVPIVEKGGTWPGWHTSFIMFPERGFALIVLTNSDGGPKLIRGPILDDWALRRFAGVSNTPAEPRALTEAELAPYEGLYTGRIMLDEGLSPMAAELKADNGQLHMTLLRRPESAAVPGDPHDIAEPEELERWREQRLAFYRDDYVLVYDAASGEPTGTRADFIRDADGNLAWLRSSGRLFRHPGAT